MNPMRNYLIPLLVAFAAIGGTLHAQTINWGSAMFNDIVDSNGNTLDNTFVFELGSFVNGYTPDADKPEDWLANWQAFDVAAYNGVEANPIDDDGIYGYFGSVATMNAGGTSNSSGQTPGAISFEGLKAYMWIRNSTVMQADSEWMLVSANAWVFPAPDSDCCGNSLPIEWSTSDLTASITPVWGTQGGLRGGGLVTSMGNFTMQTATVVPEPSVPLLAGFAGIMLATTRRRS